MKKVVTLFLAIGASVAAFGAQPQAIKAMPKQSVTFATAPKHAQVNETARPAAFLMKNGKAVATASAAADTVRYDATYYAPYGLYYYSPYGSVAFYRLIMNPLLPYNFYYCPFGAGTWSEEGTIKAQSTPYYMQEAGDFGGDYTIPTISLPNREIQGTIYAFNDYTYGKDDIELAIAEYPSYASYFNYLGGMAWPYAWPLTQCAGVCNKYEEEDSKGGTYESANDIWYFGGRGYGEYMFGTGLQNPNDLSKTIDTLGVLVNNASPLWIDTAYLNIMTAGDSIAWAESDTLKLTLYAVSYDSLNQKYNILRDSIYGVAYAGREDLEFSFASYGYYWTGELKFAFEEEDIFGVVQPTPAIAPSVFFAELTGLQDIEAEFGIWADASQMNLGTYYVIGDSLVDEIPVTYQETATYLGGHNIMLGFQSYWPSIAFEEDTVYIPLEGGTATYKDGTDAYFYTSEPEDDIEVYFKSDWLSYEMDDTYFEKYFAIYPNITAEATATPRKGGMLLINQYGNYCAVIVMQEGTTGLNAVKYLNDGKRYDVLGKEVDENYKGVVIMNGKKMLQ